jgi:hypothetical protein
MELPESPLNVPMGTSLFLTLAKAVARQVDAAIDALQRGDFDVALTLAGAAEGMIERNGLHMFGELKKSPKALERFSQKEWISILNVERDWLKHGGQPTMEIPCSSAAYMIARAASKIDEWTPKMVSFKIWLLANLDRI